MERSQVAQLKPPGKLNELPTEVKTGLYRREKAMKESSALVALQYKLVFVKVNQQIILLNRVHSY